VSWGPQVVVITATLPRPVGIFTEGVVEVWGSSLRVPGISHYQFMSHQDATALGKYIASLWEQHKGCVCT
jgi:hypothetical protein